MLQNATVETLGNIQPLYISYGATAHAELLQLQVDCSTTAPIVAGDRANYDVFLPRTPTRFSLEALSAKLSPGPAGRRLIVSAQASCSQDDARFISFLAQFLQIDVLGACTPYVTYNTRHARELLRQPLKEGPILQRYNFAILALSASLADWGQGPPGELWEILAAGAVPVYWGGQGLDRWLPDPLAAINAADFGSPLALAGYLQDISTDQDKIVRHHLWRHRVKGQCMDHMPQEFCQALRNQIPGHLSLNGLKSATMSRLGVPEAEYLCKGRRTREQEQKWLHACYGMLPAHEAAFDHHELQASFRKMDSQTEVGGILTISGEEDGLDVLLEASSTVHLKPTTPRLQEQWMTLSDLMHQEQLFRESTVLQLGLRPRDAVPLAALAAVCLGRASFARVWTPKWAQAALQGLQDFLRLGGREDLLRLPSMEDYRHTRSASLWLDVGRNEFLKADVVFALGDSLSLLLSCLGLSSLPLVVGLLRQMANTALVLEWVGPTSGESQDLRGPSYGVDGGRSYTREELVEALEVHFQHVAPLFKGNYYLCLGPRWSDWQAVQISDLSVPQFQLQNTRTGKDFQLLAQSGFLWGGAAFSKQVQVADDVVRKITPMLFGLKQAMFLHLFAPTFACVPKLVGHQSGRRPLWSLVAMERLDGTDLLTHIKQMTGPRDVLELLMASIDLLCCLVRHGVRHNDLWASNIMVLPAAGGGGSLETRYTSRIRLAAIDFEAAELTVDGLYDFVDEALSLGGSGSTLSRARDFLRENGVHAVELPPLAPTFHVAEGLADEVSLDKQTDRGMLGSVLKYHLLDSPNSEHLVGLAEPYRHIIEALREEGPLCEASDEASCGAEESLVQYDGWRLQDIREMLLAMA